MQATLLYFGGLGSLQKRSNNLNTTTAGYSETFQSSLQVRNGSSPAAPHAPLAVQPPAQLQHVDGQASV